MTTAQSIFVLVRPPAGSSVCRFCGAPAEFYTLGHEPELTTPFGHEPVPFLRATAPGSGDHLVAITEDAARQHADVILSHGASLPPDVLEALGYARRAWVFTATGAAVAGVEPGTEV